MFICLDIETTGFDPEQDKIIEIAACRFDIADGSAKIHEKFGSFVSLGNIRLPEAIKSLTGITDADLKNAPEFSEINPQLQNFIGDLPVIGHNIGFDISFLENEGLSLKNTFYDTYELSRVLFPSEESYALDILSQKWKFKNPSSHRASADIIATVELFEILLKTMRNLPPHLKPILKRIFEKSSWPAKTLFAV